MDCNACSLDWQVLLGGGREQMLPSTVRDPEYSDTRWGKRQDGQNLIKVRRFYIRQKGEINISHLELLFSDSGPLFALYQTLSLPFCVVHTNS